MNWRGARSKTVEMYQTRTKTKLPTEVVWKAGPIKLDHWLVVLGVTIIKNTVHKVLREKNGIYKRVISYVFFNVFKFFVLLWCMCIEKSGKNSKRDNNFYP